MRGRKVGRAKFKGVYSYGGISLGGGPLGPHSWVLITSP